MTFVREIVLFFGCLTLLFLPAYAHPEQVPLVTQVTIYHTDSVSKYRYIYNEQNKKTLETRYVLYDGTWIRRNQTEWVFSDKVCTQQYFRTWVDGNWKSVYQIDFEYTDGVLTREKHADLRGVNAVNVSVSEWLYQQDMLKTKTDYVWNGTMWVTKCQADYGYNENNRMNMLSLKEFVSNVPVKETKIDFKYNEFSKVDSLITTEKQDEKWINKSLTKICYDPVSRLKTVDFLKGWDSIYHKWENEQNVEYVYDVSGKLAFEKYQHWSGLFWINDLQYKYEYNADGALIKQTTYLPIYDDYRAVHSVNYTDFKYGEAGLIEAKNEFWSGGETGAPINTFIPYQFNDEMAINSGSKIEISYIPFDDTGLVTSRKVTHPSTIHVYPNPSKGIFYFECEKNQVSSWSVSDMSGKLLVVKEQKEHSGVIDLGDFNSGIYLLRVNTPDGIKIQRLIKE